MKKLIFIALISALALNVASCDKKDETTPPSSLVGTSWVTSSVEHGYTETLTFLTESTGTGLTSYSYDEEDTTYNFTYVYSYPNISITILGEGTFQGVINGNTMTCWDDIYVKK